MAASSEHEQDNLNTFQEDADFKVEKDTMYVEVEKAIDAEIQAELAAAKSIENEARNTGVIKPSNLEIEAALNNTLAKGTEEATSSNLDGRDFLTECQLAASCAIKMSEDARRVVATGRELMETILSTIEVLQSQVRAFSVKAIEVTEGATERSYRIADFYNTMTSKYDTTVKTLEKKAKYVKVALSKVEEAADHCIRFGELCRRIKDETLDEAIRMKSSAFSWTNNGKAAIIVALKMERSAVLTMRRMWIEGQNDIESEDRLSEDSGEATQQCENRDKRTQIGHILTTILGLFLLSITCLFEVGSDSFNAILALGVLTTGWCALYWSHKMYKCLKKPIEETVIETEERDGFLGICDRHLEIIKEWFLKYNITVNSDDEYDSGSYEIVKSDDMNEQ